jgi:DNA repair photolyase
MTLEFEEYEVKKIVNSHKHVDSWFWDKYSAMPYVGCRTGCEFCYCRSSSYSQRDPEHFDTHIKIKINAVDRLKRELPRLTTDVINCGDWQQPAENRYRLSRQMLEVVKENRFPLFIVERSPLLTRDLDLLVEINKQTWVGVVFSFSNVDPLLKRAFEPRSAGLGLRLKAMETIAQAGILVGMAFMPIIPVVGDDKTHLEDAVRAAKDHGANFVLGSGLTMGGVQALRTLAVVKNFNPDAEPPFRQLYRWQEGERAQYSSAGDYSTRISLTVRDLCCQYGMDDRMPRYIPPGPLAANKWVTEKLLRKMYDLELEQAKDYRIWAYRKAAWLIDEMEESIAEQYKKHGINGLKELPGIGNRLAGEIGRWLQEQL